jgi:NADPH:quinone reductase-like Zn-dependent oxidoreductase
MNKLLLAAIVGGAMTALVLGTPTAWAAPAGIGSAEETADALERSGYRVVVDKVGDLPLDQCSVAAVQPGGGSTQPMSTGRHGELDTLLLTAKC